MAESRPGSTPSHCLAGQELPGPEDRFALEVVAEAEVAQHFEERMVVGRAADVLDIARAEAFLAGRGPGEVELAAAEEVVLELVHARRREQHGRVPAGHQHVAGPADTAFRFEERQVFFPQFVAFHGNHSLGMGEIGWSESLIIAGDAAREKSNRSPRSVSFWSAEACLRFSKRSMFVRAETCDWPCLSAGSPKHPSRLPRDPPLPPRT